MDYPKFIVSNQMEESISIQRANIQSSLSSASVDFLVMIEICIKQNVAFIIFFNKEDHILMLLHMSR